MAPCDFLENVIERWTTPTNDCIRSIKFVYGLIIIAGTLISIYSTVRAFLKPHHTQPSHGLNYG
jgi:hypothetical protein